jgi:hypothetical protein
MDISVGNWQDAGAVATVAITILTLIGVIVIPLVLHRGQRRRESLTAFDDYRRELLGFAKDVIFTMSQVQELIATNPALAKGDKTVVQDAFFNRRSELFSKLSSLIDYGRFFFPNYEAGKFGQHKGAPYQGFRDPVLDRVIAAYHGLSAVDYEDFARNQKRMSFAELCTEKRLLDAFRHLSEEEQQRLERIETNQGRSGITLKEIIVSAKRSFVNEIFTIIQPRDWLENVEKTYRLQLRSRKPVDPEP